MTEKSVPEKGPFHFEEDEEFTPENLQKKIMKNFDKLKKEFNSSNKVSILPTKHLIDS